MRQRVGDLPALEQLRGQVVDESHGHGVSRSERPLRALDRLLVRVTGTKIRKNRAVATLYSPEIYTATRELAIAARDEREETKG